MIITIVIFFIAIIYAFGMLAFRAWEIRTLRVNTANTEPVIPEISFRHVEKSMLYLTKHVIQWIVLTTVKYWFLITTKIQKVMEDKWPKISKHLQKKEELPKITPPSFVKRAVLESKIKIKRIKEKVKREHE